MSAAGSNGRGDAVEMWQAARAVIYSAFAEKGLRAHDRTVLAVVALETLSYGRRASALSTHRIAKLSGLHRRHVHAALQRLEKAGRIVSMGGGLGRGGAPLRQVTLGELNGTPHVPLEGHTECAISENEGAGNGTSGGTEMAHLVAVNGTPDVPLRNTKESKGASPPAAVAGGGGSPSMAGTAKGKAVHPGESGWASTPPDEHAEARWADARKALCSASTPEAWTNYLGKLELAGWDAGQAVLTAPRAVCIYVENHYREDVLKALQGFDPGTKRIRFEEAPDPKGRTSQTVPVRSADSHGGNGRG